MHNEKEQDLQKDQNKQVDYQSLMDSLIKEKEQKEGLNQATENPQTSWKKRPQQKSKKRTSQPYNEQNKSVSTEDHHNYLQKKQRAAAASTAKAKKGKFYQSLCPYCGKKVGLFRTWMLKNKGDYFCNECGNHAAVVIDKFVLPMAITAIVISVLLVLLFTFLVDMHIWSIFLIFLPFLIFFCASVFLVRLKRIAPPGTKRKKKPAQDDLQHTRVI